VFQKSHGDEGASTVKEISPHSSGCIATESVDYRRICIEGRVNLDC